jgi:hypothetical protein
MGDDNMFKVDFAVYIPEVNVFGDVASIDFLTNSVTVKDSDGEFHTANIDKVERLDYLGKFKGQNLFNRDVLKTYDGKLFEIEAQEDGMIQLHLLDKRLNRVEGGKKFDKFDIYKVTPHVVVVGNYFQLLQDIETVDFNIKIVRMAEDAFYNYYYACNNKAKGTIDLIKVIYMGSVLLPEEDYERIEMAYDTYLDFVDNGTITIASPRELQNYVTGVTYNGKSHSLREVTVNDLEEEIEAQPSRTPQEQWEAERSREDEDVCLDCLEVDCTCEPWML